jgi:phenylalanyl-tRNA synthetase beta chain
MDILIQDRKLRQIIDTKASPQEIQDIVSLSGPTVDRVRDTSSSPVYEIEAITNRIDTASTYGFAREVHAIFTHLGRPSNILIDPYKLKLDTPSPSLPKLDINILDTDAIVRLMAIQISDIKISDSDIETAKYLTDIDERPINNIVDISNQITNLFGLPNHIFDIDTITDGQLNFRSAAVGESLTLLDGTHIETQTGDIVIEDGSGRLIDLCGVMGGQTSQITSNTKNILVLVPVYHPRRIRQTSIRTNHRTLASQIYEKSPDPELCPGVISALVDKILDSESAHITSQLYDYYPHPYTTKTITLDHTWLTRFSGTDIPVKDTIDILHSLGFDTTTKKTKIEVTVPSSRHHDIDIPEDLAEEILRIYGYHHITGQLPPSPIPDTTEDTKFQTEDHIRSTLTTLGYYEVINNSLVSKPQISDSLISADTSHLTLQNPLTQDQTIMRPSLFPSLLSNYAHNQSSSDIALFEIGHVYSHTPNGFLERSRLAIITNRTWRQLKSQLTDIFHNLGLDISYQASISDIPSYVQAKAAICLYSRGVLIGHLGLVRKSVARAHDIQTEPVYLDLDLALIGPVKKIVFQPTPTTPDLIEDITLISDKPIGDIIKLLTDTPNVVQVTYLDSYQDKHSFKLHFRGEGLKKEDTDRLKSGIKI